MRDNLSISAMPSRNSYPKTANPISILEKAAFPDVSPDAGDDLDSASRLGLAKLSTDQRVNRAQNSGSNGQLKIPEAALFPNGRDHL